MIMDGEYLWIKNDDRQGKTMDRESILTANDYRRQIVMVGRCSWAGGFHGRRWVFVGGKCWWTRSGYRRRMIIDGEYL